MLCYVVVAEKDKKAFATDLKTIRFTTSPSEQTGFERMEAISEKRKDKYPHAMKIRAVNWNVICSIFKFSIVRESEQHLPPSKQPEERISK